MERIALAGLAALVLVATGCAAEAGHPEGGAGTVPQPSEGSSSPDAIDCTTFVSQGLKEHLAHVSFPSGEVDLGAEVSADLVADATSIGVQGEYVLTCAQTVVRIHTTDGSAESTNVACDAVTANDSTIWVAANGQLAEYTDYESLRANHASSTTAIDEHAANRLAPGTDGALLGVGYQSDTVLHVAPHTGEMSAPVKLEAFSSVVLGLSLASDTRLVVAPWYTDGGLFVFDAKTGARVQTLPSAGGNQAFHGLSCKAR